MGSWWRSICGGVLMLVFVVPPSAAQNRPVKSDQEMLIELEQGWNEAFYSRNVAFIDKVLADDFMATYDDGTIGDKAKELSMAAEFNQQVESSVPDAFRIKVYDKTAVVHFVLNVVGIKKGERSKLTLRYTDVWVWRDDRWQCVSTHSTKVDPR
jgi:hypothetical protein